MTEETPTDEPTPELPQRPNSADRPPSAAGPGELVDPAEVQWIPVTDSGEGHTRSRHRRTHYLSGEDLAPQGRRIKTPLILFIATCFTTFWAGCKGWTPAFIIFYPEDVADLVAKHWQDGLVYMLAVMAILVAHEMGHFIQTVRYHIPASWPFFIPIIGVPTGTMGAVIGLDGSRANRKEMFDMGISGPLAGLVICVPMGFYAIANAGAPQEIQPNSVIFHDPWLFQMMIEWVHGELPAGHALVASPLYMAAWVGMLITGLNMLPVGQLDGGHVSYCMFGKRGNDIARSFLVFVIVWMIVTNNYSWILMVVLVIFIGTDHPPTHDDEVPLGPFRYILGIASLAIPILCFMPTPISMG